MSRERLSFNVRQIDEDNFQISLITSTKSQSTRDQRDFAFLRQTTKKKKLADYGRLFDFLPSDDKTNIKEFSWGKLFVFKRIYHYSNFFYQSDAHYQKCIRRLALGTISL